MRLGQKSLALIFECFRLDLLLRGLERKGCYVVSSLRRLWLPPLVPTSFFGVPNALDLNSRIGIDLVLFR